MDIPYIYEVRIAAIYNCVKLDELNISLSRCHRSGSDWIKLQRDNLLSCSVQERFVTFKMWLLFKKLIALFHNGTDYTDFARKILFNFCRAFRMLIIRTRRDEAKDLFSIALE